MIIINGKIHGKARPRLANGHAFNPKLNIEYEKLIRLNYKEQSNKFLNGAISVTIIAYYKIPIHYTKKRLIEIKGGKDYPTKKPDIDNIVKSVLDALNGIAYDDDKQVTELTALKRWTSGEERIELELREVN